MRRTTGLFCATAVLGLASWSFGVQAQATGPAPTPPPGSGSASVTPPAAPPESAQPVEPPAVAPAALPPVQEPVVQAPPQPPEPAHLASSAPAAPAGNAKEDKKQEKDKAMSLEAVYKNGLVLRNKDAGYEVKLGASAQLDYRNYFGDSVAPDSFDIRRARIDFNSELGPYVSVRLQAALEDNPYIRNASLDLRAHDALHLRVGQMKVPFSTSWLTQDNHVDFLERGTDKPLYPFFDRGAQLWGELFSKTIVYDLGVYGGTGVDLDAPKGDIDSRPETAWRLFLQPFRNTGITAIEGLYLAGQGTRELETAPTKRFDTSGLAAANYESQIWRWRTEQVIGTNGRNTDLLTAQIGAKTRFGAELHYLNGPFTFSAEWVMLRYEKVQMFHNFTQGSKRLKHDPLASVSGNMHNVSAFMSVFLTGEKKTVDNWGFKQPAPNHPVGMGSSPGVGAWELLARGSMTLVDDGFFATTKVKGFAATDFSTSPGLVPAEGGSVTGSVLDGAKRVYEATLGVNWTLSYNVRWMLNYTLLTAPDYEAQKSGVVSGGNSDLWDATEKNKLVETEHMVGTRFIFRM